MGVDQNKNMEWVGSSAGLWVSSQQSAPQHQHSVSTWHLALRPFSPSAVPSKPLASEGMHVDSSPFRAQHDFVEN